jgi:hypothetical protein
MSTLRPTHRGRPRRRVRGRRLLILGSALFSFCLSFLREPENCRQPLEMMQSSAQELHAYYGAFEECCRSTLLADIASLFSGVTRPTAHVSGSHFSSALLSKTNGVRIFEYLTSLATLLHAVSLLESLSERDAADEVVGPCLGRLRQPRFRSPCCAPDFHTQLRRHQQTRR